MTVACGTEWRETDDFASGGFEEGGKLVVLLLDGTARTQLYLPSIHEHILPLLRSSEGACYVLLAYGDYAPNSLQVVSTVYVGFDYESMVASLSGFDFAGGSVVRNAVHEGLAAAMDAIQTLHSGDLAQSSLVLISTTLAYEDFYEHALVRECPKFSGKTLEELLLMTKTSNLMLSTFWPSAEAGAAVLSLLNRVYGAEKIKPAEVGGSWHGRSVNPSTRSRSESPDSGLPAASNALETAVRQFLAVAVKLPHAQRAEAIRKHLDSPAYSQEYKNCLIAMVRNMQQSAAGRGQLVGKASNGNAAGPSRSPLMASRGGHTPIWRGRIAFRTTSEYSFEVGALAMPNPKGVAPQLTPPIAEYHVDVWPIVLSISSFIPLRSAQVVNGLPLSKLVELIPMTVEGGINPQDQVFNGLRNTLHSRHLVGVIKLGSVHTMLLAARLNQLVGMVLFQQPQQQPPPPQQQQSQQPVPERTTNTVHPAQRANGEAPISSYITIHPSESAPRPSEPISPVSVSEPTLTPDAILRQHRPGTASAPLMRSASPPFDSEAATLDVFNTLLGVQAADDEALQMGRDGAPLEFDFAPSTSSYGPPGSLFDNFD